MIRLVLLMVLLVVQMVGGGKSHSYTHTLLGVEDEHVTGPSGLPVKETREHSATKQLWPNRDATTHFPDRAWREGVLRLRAQRGC